MQTFASHIESHTQLRHSFCSRMFMTTTCALVFVMIGLPHAASAADCPTKIKAEDCGCTISSPGQYRLDVNCSVAPSETGISIEASNVYLNLQGHTISGPGCSTDAAVPSTVGINVGASDVHIINGTARALTAGILILGTPAAPAKHNHLSHLTLRESCTGLAIRDANDNHVSGSTISANAGEGVLLINANHNVIDSNVINDNDPPGGGVAGGGLFLNNSDDNTITANIFSRNGQFGVYIPPLGSNHNTIRGNIVKDTRGGGIGVLDNNNTIHENTLRRNAPGIQLFASGNFVYRNTALGNRAFDLGDPDCHNNTWTNNIFLTDSEGDGPGKGCIR